MTKLNEAMVEQAALGWLADLGYEIRNGNDLAPDGPNPERDDYGQSLLLGQVQSALARLNPHLPSEALADALAHVQHLPFPGLLANNRAFHRLLVDGVPVEHRRPDGSIAGDLARLVEFERPELNDWLAVNQFTVVEGQINRRPDIVLFLNGLPLGVIELKNPADEQATIWAAFNQLQTYKKQIPALLAYNEALVISDGVTARLGSLSADRERFLPWRTVEGEDVAPAAALQLETLLRGVFDRRRFLDLLRFFIVFEDEGGGKVTKKMAAYHQFHAVQHAVESTVRAASPAGDRRAGVIWHTQGSGKSLTMAFYAGRLVLHPAMQNPTLVVLTDRNDLDGQLYATFSRCSELLRQTPVQAESRADLREKLRVAAGGVVFTTVQKFFPDDKAQDHPLLSDRRNIVVIADEAHRSQYDFVDGFARHMRDALPNASFIGFTGTPIELKDKNTRAVFGDYISVYDIQRAVDDGATVPIYYESRLAQIELAEQEKPHLDPEFDEVTEGEELERKEKLKTKWAALEAVVGAEKRIRLIAQDLVQHWEQRLSAMDGKAMVVCMSRRICVALYDEIVRLRPHWHSEDDRLGALKVVMTGSATDLKEWQDHIRNKPRRDAIAARFKDPADPLKAVIVRDMWLTGFDVPCLTTMYADKPMRGHGLMQAIARVNRVFKDKPGGLIVDYLGLADQLRQAVAAYTESGGQGEAVVDEKQAIAAMLEQYEICRALFHGFDWTPWLTGTPEHKLQLLPAAQDFVLGLDDGKPRLLQSVTRLTQAYALAVTSLEAIRLRDGVAFFQAVRARVAKLGSEGKSDDDLDHAISRLVSKAVAPEGVIDIFSAAGLKKPDLSILSDEFLAEVQGMPHKNLAVELLRKLLSNEIQTHTRKNLVRARSFAGMLEETVAEYRRRAIETSVIIQHLIDLAKEMRAAQERDEALGLTEDEVAFYDALEVNDSAVKILGNDTLKQIARELVTAVRGNVTIDWTVKESVRARMRLIVKRILRKYGYPPDKQERATATVLEQAELLCGDWAA